MNLFPDFDDNLRAAYQREIELFFGSIVHEDRSILDLLTANYTFVNERLAKQYGIPNIYGPQFRRVTLPADLDMRRGLLGKGALLTVTSNAARTSPVTRGKWFLQTFLGVSPPDPPPNVPAIKEQAGGFHRQREAADHARRPWKRITPIRSARRATRSLSRSGWRWKTSTRSAPGARRTETVPSMPAASWWTGPKWTASPSLRDALVRRSDQFVRVVTEKMLTYALGRGVEYQDMPLVRSIVRDSAGEQLQVLFHRVGDREEPAVPDEHEDSAATTASSGRPVNKEIGERSNHVYHQEAHFPPDGSARQRRRRWRCRFWMR